MIWERDPLWVKSKLFFERAFAEPPESSLFGLWCSLGMELLARAAVASISPALLAEPTQDHKFLLYALNRSSETSPKSISALLVFQLCEKLFSEFSNEDAKSARALVNRRNAELHSAEAAFDQYPSAEWLPSFYHICKSLSESLGESLETLLGSEVAKSAAETLTEIVIQVTSRVQAEIAAHRRVFEGKSKDEQESAANKAKEEADHLAFERHHRTDCPACKSTALIQGDAFGPERVTHEESEILVRQSVSPRSFACSACGLKLRGYAELNAAGLGGNYTRRKLFSPEEFFSLINPETDDLTPYIESYLAKHGPEYEYDNE